MTEKQTETVVIDLNHNPHEVEWPAGLFDKIFDDNEDEGDGF
ncbi:hypothetical protein OfM1_19050 [Lactovum odontotermitis]